MLGHRLLVAVCLVTPALASSAARLFERDGTCQAGWSSCANTGVPTDFCCPTGDVCIALAANTTLLCCPNSSCDTIKPITCDISAQNATLHPNATVKTQALEVPLGTCGSMCCPFGYTCSGNSQCVIDSDQTKSPEVSSSSSSSSSTSRSSSGASSSTSKTGNSASATQSTSSSTSTSSKPTTTAIVSASPATNITLLHATCNKFPAPAVLAGFFPGLILGVILSFLSIFLYGHYRHKEARRNRRSGSSFGDISEPQLNTATSIRTDFLRKPPQTPSSTASTPAATRRLTVNRVKSLFHYNPNPKSKTNTQLPPAIPRTMNTKNTGNRPFTPPNQVLREPSQGNLDIYIDGNTASSLRSREMPGDDLGGGKGQGRGSHQTTWTELLHGNDLGGLAGLQKGQPFVHKGSPGYSPSPVGRRAAHNNIV